MRSTSLTFLTLVLMGYFSTLGFAKSFDAIVTEVTDGGSGIKATITDEYGETKRDVLFHLLPNVDLSDYKSMDKIKPGNQVRIEAEIDADNNGQISKIEPYQKNR